MRLVALLSFYDEPPEFLHRMISSLTLVGVTDLVALDGAYALYPLGTASSPEEQHDALDEACTAAGIRLHLHIPASVWRGNEVEKRSRLFELGERVTTDRDWYLITDGDEEVLHAPKDLHDQLEYSVFDVAQCELIEPHKTHPDFPKFFRAVRGLHCKANHYTYATPNGRYLWGNAVTTRLEPRIPADVSIYHHAKARTEQREDRWFPWPSTARRTASLGYYLQRDNVAHTEHQHPMRSAA